VRVECVCVCVCVCERVCGWESVYVNGIHSLHNVENESHDTHTSMSHVTYIWMSHVTRMHESCHTWVTSPVQCVCSHSLICVTWLICTCDVTPSHECNMTHSYVWHGPFSAQSQISCAWSSLSDRIVTLSLTEMTMQHITFLHLSVFSGRFGCKRDFLPTTEFTTKQNTLSYLLIVYARFGGAHDFLCLYVTELLLCLWLNLLPNRTRSHTFWCCTVDSGVSVTFWPSLYDRNVTPSSFTCMCVCACGVSVCLCVFVSARPSNCIYMTETLPPLHSPVCVCVREVVWVCTCVCVCQHDLLTVSTWLKHYPLFIHLYVCVCMR